MSTVTVAVETATTAYRPGLIQTHKGAKWQCTCGWRVRVDGTATLMPRALEDAIERHEWVAHDVA